MDRGQLAADRLTIDLLGPLRVTRGTGEVTVGPAMVRNLLGLLTLHAGTTVPRGDIVEALWEGEPPTTYPNLIQGYVSRLRAQLRAGSPVTDDVVIVNTQGGYQLTVDDEAVDSARFERLLRDARCRADGADLAGAADRYEAALRCWRGPILADLDRRFDRLPAVVGLNGRRVTAAVEYGRLCHRLRRYEPATDLLRTVATTAPLHEALQAQLMLLLAGSGNRAAALTLYDETRRRLAHELGVDPGPQLQELHLQLLRERAPQRAGTDDGGERRHGDAPVPAVDAPVELGDAPPAARLPPAPRRAVRWRPSRAAPAAVLLAILLVVVGVSLVSGSDPGRPGAVRSGASTSALPSASADQFTTPVRWDWGYGHLRVTPTREQWATASVSGLVSQYTCAGFQFRVTTVPEARGEPGGLLVAVCADRWEMEGPAGDFRHVDHSFPAEGRLRVSVSSANVMTIAFDDTVVVERALHGKYAGQGITPAIYQGNDVRVEMSDIRWNAAGSPSD